jgi:hypothetical protein
MTIRNLADDLWVIDHSFKMPGGIALGTRTTIVRLRDGRLWLHSPGSLTTELEDFVKANGPLAAIVAPNLLHHLYLKETSQAFPQAGVHGPEGLEKKIGIAAQVIDAGASPWKDDFDALLVAGCPKMNETVFLHRASRTLILTDLAFNFHDVRGFGTRLFLRINGALDRFGPSRLGRLVFFGDHAQVRVAIERILTWDFDRVIVAHGDVLESGGPAALRSGYAWLLDA